MQVFRESAVYKNPANNEVFVGRNLPSFVKDYLIATHIDLNGKLRRNALVRFLDQHIPLIRMLFAVASCKAMLLLCLLALR